MIYALPALLKISCALFVQLLVFNFLVHAALVWGKIKLIKKNCIKRYKLGLLRISFKDGIELCNFLDVFFQKFNGDNQSFAIWWAVSSNVRLIKSQSSLPIDESPRLLMKYRRIEFGSLKAFWVEEVEKNFFIASTRRQQRPESSPSSYSQWSSTGFFMKLRKTWYYMHLTFSRIKVWEFRLE